MTTPRHIAISGASRGIGEAVAYRLARPGDRFVLLARSEDRLAEVCARLREVGAEAEYLAVDLSSLDSAARAAECLRERVERLDVLVLNAGMSNDRTFARTRPEDARYELGVNYVAPMTLLHRLLPSMRGREDAHVVCVGSLTSILPFPCNATYAASKAALLALVRGLRVELAEEAMHLGIVLPGLTDTDIVPDSGAPVRLPRASVDEVADAVAECIDERAGVVIPGWSNQIAARLWQSFPSVFDGLLEKTARYVVPGFEPESEGA
jgi:uncharacterized protein